MPTIEETARIYIIRRRANSGGAVPSIRGGESIIQTGERQARPDASEHHPRGMEPWWLVCPACGEGWRMWLYPKEATSRVEVMCLMCQTYAPLVVLAKYRITARDPRQGGAQ